MNMEKYIHRDGAFISLIGCTVFGEHYRRTVSELSVKDTVDEGANQVTSIIVNSASLSISKTVITGSRNLVPWWNDNCNKVIKRQKQRF